MRGILYLIRMKIYDYLIIGNGIAGVTAAETIRENDSSGTIAIVSNEPYVLYSRVLLPSYLKNRIPRDKVFLRNIRDYSLRKIDLYVNKTVQFLDTARKEVGGEGGFLYGYKKLLIASGGRAREWESGNEENIYRLQTLDDADRVFRSLSRVKKPLVVGASFISLEFLEILLFNKTPPKLIVRDTHFFSRMLDRSGAELLHQNFARKGIVAEYGNEVTGIGYENGTLQIKRKTPEGIGADAVFLGIGITRNLEFLQGSQILLGDNGIATDQFLETNIKGVFASGDVAEYFDVIAEKQRTVGNWTSAFLQGKTVGLNMLGKQILFSALPTYSITNLGFQITALGDTDNALENVICLDSLRNRYARFFFRGNMLAGVFLINRFRDKAHLSRIIESRSLIGDWRKKLVDPLFDIQTISVLQ